MLGFYILLVLLILSSLKYVKDFNSGYLAVSTTNAVKGVFILLVFIKHITPYILKSGYVYGGWAGEAFRYIDSHVGQWIVAMFLFYSGYGIMESIAKKGEAYIYGIPKKRMLTVAVNFAIAVIVFSLVGGILGKTYPIKHYLLSLIGWESVGNSNWYIFVIMLCYLITYISFRRSLPTEGNAYYGSAFRCVVLLSLSAIVLSFFKSYYWYDTMLCFGAGLFYSLFKKKTEGFVRKHYWATLAILMSLLIVTELLSSHARGFTYNVFSVVLCLLMVTLTMRCEINSKILMWCGANLFPLYIYQRIPMIVLSEVGHGKLVCTYPVLYIYGCLIVTVLIAFFYKYWAVKL